MSSHTRFLQINLQHNKAASRELEAFCVSLTNTVILVQEPYLYKNNVCLFPKGWKRFSTPGARAAIYITPDISAISHASLNTPDCSCIFLTSPKGPVLVASVYCDILKDFSSLESVVAFAQSRGIKSIVGTDSNAWSTLWGPKNNARGELLEDILLQYDTDVHNLPQNIPTFESNRGSSFIDLTLSHELSQDNILGWRVQRFPDTDHNMITFRVTLDVKPRKKRIWSKTDWKQYETDLQSKDWSIPDRLSPLTIDRMANTITKRMHKALDDNGLVTTVRIPEKDTWTNNPAIVALRRKKGQAYQKSLFFQDERATRTYNKLKNDLVKATKKHQKESFRKKITALRNTEGLSNLINVQQNKPELQHPFLSPCNTEPSVLDVSRRDPSFTLQNLSG